MPTATYQRPALEDIAADTMTGDVREFFLNWFKASPKAWPQMSEREQEAFRDACARQSEALVRKVTQIVGAQDHLSLEITTRDFNRKGERLEAKITTPYSLANLDALARASDAGPIVLSVVSLDQYRGERAPARIMKDQPDLMDDVAEGETEADRDGAVEATEQVGHVPDATAADDALATDQQQAALAEAVGDGGTEVADDQQDQPLGPEAQANTDLLAGIQPLDASAAEPLADRTAPAPKKRGKRRTVEQRVADNAAAVDSAYRVHN